MTPALTPAVLIGIADKLDARTEHFSPAEEAECKTIAYACRTLAAILEAPGKVSAERALELAAYYGGMAERATVTSWADTATLIREALASRARIAALESETARFKEWLLKIACLGNGDRFGNSDGNCMAIDALGGKAAAQALKGSGHG